MKIQSISDLITNSSTESFLVVSGSASRIIKELFEAISNEKFNEHFEFVECYEGFYAESYFEYILDKAIEEEDNHVKELIERFFDGDVKQSEVLLAIDDSGVKYQGIEDYTEYRWDKYIPSNFELIPLLTMQKVFICILML